MREYLHMMPYAEYDSRVLCHWGLLPAAQHGSAGIEALDLWRLFTAAGAHTR